MALIKETLQQFKIHQLILRNKSIPNSSQGNLSHSEDHKILRQNIITKMIQKLSGFEDHDFNRLRFLFIFIRVSIFAYVSLQGFGADWSMVRLGLLI
jgi:hypothetical protein